MYKTRIIKFKDKYGQDAFLAQKKGLFNWKPLNWSASWHTCLEHAQSEIDEAIRKDYLKQLTEYEVINYP